MYPILESQLYTQFNLNSKEKELLKQKLYFPIKPFVFNQKISMDINWNKLISNLKKGMK